MNLIERRRQMMSGGREPQQGTLVVYPSSYDTVDIQGSVSGVEKMYTPYDSNTVGLLLINRLKSCWMYLIFDSSALPSNATILSATCIVRAYSQIATKKVQMYSQGSAKGSEQDFTTDPSISKSLSFDLSNWSSSELRDCKIKIYASRTSGTDNLAIGIYGATLTINYEY